MAFWETYFHVVWATYRRTPYIQPHHEPFVHEKIREKSVELGCPVHAVNMMPDHVHVAVSIKPAISQSDWVRQVKGYTSHEMNATYKLDTHFRWQKSFGITTLGRNQLPIALEYIKNQKLHHANNEVYKILENYDDTH